VEEITAAGEAQGGPPVAVAEEGAMVVAGAMREVSDFLIARKSTPGFSGARGGQDHIGRTGQSTLFRC